MRTLWITTVVIFATVALAVLHLTQRIYDFKINILNERCIELKQQRDILNTKISLYNMGRPKQDKIS